MKTFVNGSEPVGFVNLFSPLFVHSIKDHGSHEEAMLGRFSGFYGVYNEAINGGVTKPTRSNGS